MARSTYESLVLAMRKIEAAMPVGPGAPSPWIREVLDDPALAAASGRFVDSLGTDEADQTQGTPADRHRAGAPQWLTTTGVADPGAVLELDDLWGRIKNSLGA